MFQPLDLTVNSWTETFKKEKYAVWYASQIVDKIDVKTPRTTIKLLHAKCVAHLYDNSHQKREKKPFLTAGRLKCLDHLNDLDPLGRGSISFKDNFQFFEEANPDVNERYESDSVDEYILDNERNVFNPIAV